MLYAGPYLMRISLLGWMMSIKPDRKSAGKANLTQVDRWHHSVSDVVEYVTAEKVTKSIFNILYSYARGLTFKQAQTRSIFAVHGNTCWLFMIAIINWEFLTRCVLAIINRTHAFLKFKMAARQIFLSTLVLKIGTTFLTAALRKTEAIPHSADQLPH
jgi:hypothetical protein